MTTRWILAAVASIGAGVLAVPMILGNEPPIYMDEPRLAASHASSAGQPPLALFATRLDGRAAAARGETERAIELLGSAAEGFKGLEAEWEAAVTLLDLARVLMDSGNAGRAHELVEEHLEVFSRIGSVRERNRANELLGRPGVS